jgi:hypothetical protein
MASSGAPGAASPTRERACAGIPRAFQFNPSAIAEGATPASRPLLRTAASAGTGAQMREDSHERGISQGAVRIASPRG